MSRVRGDPALHLATALRLRRYGPGLGTALALFLPFGAYSIRAIGTEARATRRAHGLSLAAAIALHLLVVLGVVRARAAREEPPPSNVGPAGGS